MQVVWNPDPLEWQTLDGKAAQACVYVVVSYNNNTMILARFSNV